MTTAIPAVVYGTDATRITIFDAGGTPLTRYTLQAEEESGMVLTFPSEGLWHQLGSGASWRRVWAPRGFRPTLSLKWDFGLSSTMQTWTGSAWGSAVEIETATALSKILSGATSVAALVEPRLDKAFSFDAQPDPSKPLGFKDAGRVVHAGLTLDLVAATLIASIPVW